MLLFCIRTNERRRSIEECLDGEQRKKETKKKRKEWRRECHTHAIPNYLCLFLHRTLHGRCLLSSMQCTASISFEDILITFVIHISMECSEWFFLFVCSFIDFRCIVFIFEWRLVLQMTFLTLDISRDLNRNTKVNLSPQAVFFV